MKNRSRAEVLGLNFKNPILVASTDIARSPDKLEQFAKSGVGGIVTKSVTDAAALQQKGIARICVTDMRQNRVKGGYPEEYYFFSRGGSMLSMEAFADEAADMLRIGRTYETVLIASISASRIENWVAYAKELEALGFPAIELNFGNPHGEAADGKLGFLIGQSPRLCGEIAQAVLQAVHIPVFAKLTPQISDLVELTRYLQSVGVRAVTVMHRFQGLMVDPQSDLPVLGGWAAIGGPWMKPISLANVAKVYRGTDLTVVGGNGADTARDIYDFVCCGASLVEVGSSMMLRGADYAKDLVAAFDELLREKKIADYRELIGRTARQIVPYQKLASLPDDRPVYHTEICGVCREMPCLQTCFFGGLCKENGRLIHKEDLCSGCGLCAQTCPHAAVEMRRVERKDE